MKKRTCGGCRAMYLFDSLYGDYGCILGYKHDHDIRNELSPNGRYGYTTQIPLEECPKPRTIEKLMELMHEREKKLLNDFSDRFTEKEKK